MPRSRFHRLEPDRQEAILAEAGTEFAERGYEAASLNRIIERAGISKGALYYYFDDKADLFQTVMETAVARMLEAVNWEDPSHFTEEDYWERWRLLTERSLELLRGDAWYTRVALAYTRFQDEPVARAALTRLSEEKLEQARAVLARGQELGEVRTDLPLELLVEAAAAVGEASGRWIMRRWASLSEAERRALLEARLDLTRDMLDARHMGWGK
jgi:AcrR family transcriptional regulator